MLPENILQSFGFSFQFNTKYLDKDDFESTAFESKKTLLHHYLLKVKCYKINFEAVTQN